MDGTRLRATTIVAVHRDGITALAGDGQVTVGEIVMKAKARKIRRLYQDTVLAGFAGAVADAITLFDKFDAQLERYSGNVGQTGGILGQGFTGATSVELNGTPAQFTVVSDTFIRATVPPGAQSGYVTVTTPTGTLNSDKPFQLIP